MKRVNFLGDAQAALKAFPEEARSEAGYQLYRVQKGQDAKDWRPMPSVGPGVREIRVRTADGSFRVIYLANFQEAIYVLHAFQKKTRRTPKRDLDLATTRLRELMRGIS